MLFFWFKQQSEHVTVVPIWYLHKGTRSKEKGLTPSGDIIIKQFKFLCWIPLILLQSSKYNKIKYLYSR